MDFIDQTEGLIKPLFVWTPNITLKLLDYSTASSEHQQTNKAIFFNLQTVFHFIDFFVDWRLPIQ